MKDLDFCLRDRGCRLIHDNDLGIDRNRLDDLNDLAVRDGQGTHERMGVILESQLIDQALCLAEHELFVDHFEFVLRKPSQENVLSDGQIRHRVQLLMDGRHTLFLHISGIVCGDFLSEDIYLALIGRIHSVDTFDQCRFAGTILTHQYVDFPFVHCEADIIQRLNTRK